MHHADTLKKHPTRRLVSALLAKRPGTAPGIACVAILLLAAGPLWPANPLVVKHPSMGTEFTLHLHASQTPATQRAVEAAIARIDAINRIASDYLPDSELSRLNLAPAHQETSLSPDLFVLLERALVFSRQTHGAFDVTIAWSVQNWRRAKRQHQLPSPERLQKAVALTNWRNLQLDFTQRTITKLKDDVRIDLGGIAKGYAADAALAVLRDHGIVQALVAASGDLAIGDPPPGESGWRVTLRTFQSDTADDPQFQVLLHNCGCSTSGDLHQFFEINGNRYSHIIDPATGLGLTNRIACTIIAPDATTSDVLATAACVLGPAQIRPVLQTFSETSMRMMLGQPSTPPLEILTGPRFMKVKNTDVTPTQFKE